MIKIRSWGQLDYAAQDRISLTNTNQAIGWLKNITNALPHGMGRSYGDSCLNPGGVLLNTLRLDRFIAFDKANGILVCEAGVLLKDIHALTIPQGWMLAVTPGTQYITIGGAIANDVHGKNHSLFGSFGHHIKKITLARTTGELIECGPQLHPDWYAATLGGVGLTGLILTVTIQLRPVKSFMLHVETIPFYSVDEFFHLSDNSLTQWAFQVAWFDSTTKKTRGIFTRAHPDALANRKGANPIRLKAPFTPPFSLINSLSIPLLNKLYFLSQGAQQTVIDHHSFAYPLDNLHYWNRLYGRKGFYQYQAVIPTVRCTEVIPQLISEINRSSESSFLSTFKIFGPLASLGMLSFPIPGITMALDFPNRGATTLQLFDRLDSLIQQAGGRLYLAKDARMTSAFFAATYPRLAEFLPYRDKGLSSALARRLMDE